MLHTVCIDTHLYVYLCLREVVVDYNVDWTECLSQLMVFYIMIIDVLRNCRRPFETFLMVLIVCYQRQHLSFGGNACRNLADNLAVMDFMQGSRKAKELVVHV